MTMRTYLGISRDHSGSMSSLREPARKDYNSTIAAVLAASQAQGIETIVSTVICDSVVQREHITIPIASVPTLSSYRAGGGTPLFLSVLDLIKQFEALPDYNDPEVTFIVMATTDGQDTNGGAEQLAKKIRELQATDRWTFAFRVPRGYARDLARMGIEAGNILEWDQTQRGVEASTQANTQAFNDFYTARSTGVRSSKTFYSNLKDVTVEDVKKALQDISSEVNIWPVSAAENDQQIREVVEQRLNGGKMLKGAAFYQLTKTEDKIQDYKLIAIRDKNSGAIYCGPEARDMMGLPRIGDARVAPQDHGNFDVFVQSTSVNRKVKTGTQLMYWPNVGIRFKEGKSA
jgi:hypothetical protein